MEAQTARTRSKLIGFAFGLLCLLITYFSGVRFYEHLLLDRAPDQGLSFALDLAGNGLLLSMSILGIVAVILINRRGLDGVIQNWPYLATGGLFAMLIATPAAGLSAAFYGQPMSFVLAFALFWGLAGLWSSWSVLKKQGLPINARASDVSAARKQDAPKPIANRSAQGRSVWWKIFAVLNALISLWDFSHAHNYETVSGLLGLVLDIPATIGLFLFAFSRTFLSARFWKSIAVIYAVWWLTTWLIEIPKETPKLFAEHDPGAITVLIAILSAYQFLIVLGLWRHSTQTAQTIAAGPMATHVPPIGPAPNMPIGVSDHSDFPRVYGLADRSLFLMLAIIFGTSAVWFSALVAKSFLYPTAAAARALLDPTTRASMQAADVQMIVFIIFLCFFTSVLVATVVRAKLVLQEDAITLTGPFRTRSIRKQDIAGRRRLLKIKAGVLILVPAHAGVRPLAIRPKFETDWVFDAWLKDIPDLDAT